MIDKVKGFLAGIEAGVIWTVEIYIGVSSRVSQGFICAWLLCPSDVFSRRPRIQLTTIETMLHQPSGGIQRLDVVKASCKMLKVEQWAYFALSHEAYQKRDIQGLRQF